MTSNRTFAILVLSLLILTESSCISQQAPPARFQSLIAQLDKTAAEMVKDPKAASITIGLVDNQGIVWARSYGYANIEKRVPATVDSVYRIGSITKQFTALMLLQLVHQGKVHFSDPVEKYFPEIHLVKGAYKDAPPITLIQLATHRSGLDSEPDTEASLKGPVADWEKTLIAALPHTTYVHEPDRYFSYSNIGYAILGAALARAAHVPYTTYVREKILQPLGMSHTDFEPTPLIAEHLATGYEPLYPDRIDTTLPEMEQKGRGYKVPNGALYTTLGDLARFETFEMLNGPDAVLPRHDLEDSRGQVMGNDDLSLGYGIGFELIRSGGHIFLGHPGSVAGYSAMAFVQTRASVGIVILRNQSGPGIEKLLDVFTNNLEVK